MTVFERCVEAAGAAGAIEIRVRDISGNSFAAQITTAVLTALAEYTGSPLTCDEVMRVLGEEG